MVKTFISFSGWAIKIFRYENAMLLTKQEDQVIKTERVAKLRAGK